MNGEPANKPDKLMGREGTTDRGTEIGKEEEEGEADEEEEEGDDNDEDNIDDEEDEELAGDVPVASANETDAADIDDVEVLDSTREELD